LKLSIKPECSPIVQNVVAKTKAINSTRMANAIGMENIQKRYAERK